MAYKYLDMDDDDIFEYKAFCNSFVKRVKLNKSF